MGLGYAFVVMRPFLHDIRQPKVPKPIRVAALGVVMVAVVGCKMSADLPDVHVPPTRLTLLNETIRVRAPQGYCIDEESLQDHDQSAFVLMAGCDGLMGLPSGTMVPPAVLTVTALRPDVPVTSVKEVARSLQSGTLLVHREADGLTLMQLDDPDSVPQDSATKHWRGAMLIEGVIVTLAVYGDEDIAENHGEDLLQSLALRISIIVPPEDGSGTTPPKKKKNLLQRIFN
jgi:hypothetical protein